MSHFIDRRLNGKNKSTVNRQRFLKRYKAQLQESVRDIITGRRIEDVDTPADVSIPRKDLSEPTFHHAPGKGVRDVVHPGNKEFMPGDKIQRPQGGSGSGAGSGRAGKGGVGEDDFVFTLSREEFLDLLFDGLALPDMVRKELARTTEWKSVRSGFRTVGSPHALDVVRTMRGSLARRMALGNPHRRRILELEQEIARLVAERVGEEDPVVRALYEELATERARLVRLPFLDDFDIRYRAFTHVPLPSEQAVMVCLMDVSGSMDAPRKLMAKQFFIMLHLFLKRNYEHIELVFIRHHTTAEEVDEDTFFYKRETGGTLVSSGLECALMVIQARYPPSKWNIYLAQASDGDNWDEDSVLCEAILHKKLLPLLQYMVYIEITARQKQSLWHTYASLRTSHRNLAIQEVHGPEDVYPVFRDLFSRHGVGA